MLCSVDVSQAVWLPGTWWKSAYVAWVTYFIHEETEVEKVQQPAQSHTHPFVFWQTPLDTFCLL